MGTSYFLEKQAVVIDFGVAYTKVGFATESRPRHILPSPELRARGEPSRELTTSASEQQWVDILDRLLNKIFFHYLSVSPKDRRVVILDSVLSPAQFRHALAFVLFKRLSVPSVSFVTDLVLPLYLTGLSSGIVLDLGFRSTRVLATFAGVPVISAYRTATPGGWLIARRLRQLLEEAMGPEAAAAATWLSDPASVEDLMVRACYVASENLVAGEKEPVVSLKTTKAITFTPNKGPATVVPEHCRWQPAESLFTGSDIQVASGVREEELCDGGCEGCSSATVQAAFVEVLERCPVDVRAAVVQNVVVVGGCAALRGLLPRLAAELRSALKESPKMAALADRLRFTPLDFAPVCATWTGGAVFGALEGAGDFNASDYSSGKQMPDWSRDGFV